MKKQAFTTITMLGLFLMPAVVSVYAQNHSADRIVVQIPFDFVAGNKTLPAGEYIVRSTLATRVTLIRNASGRREYTTISTMAVPAETMPTAAKLVFHKYGDRYFLSQVWTPERNLGGELSESRAERELARNASKPQTVTIAAR
jgi:hypothetical protein